MRVREVERDDDGGDVVRGQIVTCQSSSAQQFFASHGRIARTDSASSSTVMYRVVVLEDTR